MNTERWLVWRPRVVTRYSVLDPDALGRPIAALRARGPGLRPTLHWRGHFETLRNGVFVVDLPSSREEAFALGGDAAGSPIGSPARPYRLVGEN